MSVETPEDLLLHELQDLYYVEQKLVRVLDDVAGTVEHPRLSKRLRAHASESKGHAERLEQAFRLLGEEPTGEQCPAFDGIKQEHDEFVAEEQPSPAVYDLFVAGAAGGRIEHYEIAGYTSAIALATSCGRADVAKLLQQTLREEEQMLDDSQQIAESMLAGGPTGAGDGSADLESMTVDELREQAAERDIEGRSSMNKSELVEALQG